MPRIKIEWLSTRTHEQRQALVNRITEAFVDIVKVRPEQVTVIFEEISPRLQAKGGVFWEEILKKKDEGS